MSYRILVTGSRTWPDYPRLCFELGKAIGETSCDRDEIVIVHGACPEGADKMAAVVADVFGYAVEPHPADWSKGKQAGFTRNADMVAAGADICLAFLDRCFKCHGVPLHGSHGAAHCASLAWSAKIFTKKFHHGW